MCDVNPLGPMMHLKEIERDAVVFRAARMESHSEALRAALEQAMKLAKRLRTSLKALNAGDSAKVGN
jgi:hypothetical protein